ncbi:MAG: 50S ribosomal protein L2 [Candidatus Bathyarchaeia archaeon]
MGKKLKVQRRGRGTSLFRANKKGKVADTGYPPIQGETLRGDVMNLMHEPGRGAPLAHITLINGEEYHIPAPEGVAVGQEILFEGSKHEVGNTLHVHEIPEGVMVNNVELKPGDGGKLARSSGTFATIIGHSEDRTVLKLPSKKNVSIPDKARATVGIVSGGGRREKPFLKAGEKHHAARAKGQVYPVTKGVKMTAASHPHGGGRHRRAGKSTTVSRHAPPGAKVGLIAARASGKKKRKR